METCKTECLVCRKIHRWYPYSVADESYKVRYNQKHRTTCYVCGSHRVRVYDDPSTLTPYLKRVNVRFTGVA